MTTAPQPIPLSHTVVVAVLDALGEAHFRLASAPALRAVFFQPSACLGLGRKNLIADDPAGIVNDAINGASRPQVRRLGESRRRLAQGAEVLTLALAPAQQDAPPCCVPEIIRHAVAFVEVLLGVNQRPRPGRNQRVNLRRVRVGLRAPFLCKPLSLRAMLGHLRLVLHCAPIVFRRARRCCFPQDVFDASDKSAVVLRGQRVPVIALERFQPLQDIAAHVRGKGRVNDMCGKVFHVADEFPEGLSLRFNPARRFHHGLTHPRAKCRKVERLLFRLCFDRHVASLRFDL